MKKITLLVLIIIGILSPSACLAQPYGKGIYNENIPYGSQTSLSITTSGNVSIQVTPTAEGTLATGASNVTVTSTDVMGYKLYIRSLTDTSMNNLGATLLASANSSPAALLVNTWGYNTDASTNFIGLTLDDTLIRSVSAPAPSGDVTTITYGVKVDMEKPAGNYEATVIYTAVPQTD